MKNTMTKIIFASIFISITGYGVYKSKQKVELSDLTIANIEALAQSETGDEFTNATDCVACVENRTCKGKDGRLYSYSIPKANSGIY